MITTSRSARNLVACAVLLAGSLEATTAPSLAQQVERRAFTIGSALKRDLDAHQLDSAQIEDVADGVVEGISTGNAMAIIDHAGADVRVTAGDTNKVVGKSELTDYVKRLLAAPRLREDVLDNDEVVIKDDEVGLARGTFWIRQSCVYSACRKKKSSIVTINLP